MATCRAKAEYHVATAIGWPSRVCAIAIASLIGGCGDAESKYAHNPGRPTAAAPAGMTGASPAPAKTIAALYTADFARAVAGEKKVPPAASGDFGDMRCLPQRISGADQGSRALTLTLPADPATRKHVLAVVTPERGLLEIYTWYEDPSQSEDIIIPNRYISWSKARTRRRFAVNADYLEGLRPGSDKPEILFLERGRYRFALVNGISRDLLKPNKAALKVFAACSFDWIP